ncbi:MAG: LysR family transcriptional regulator [Spirochaetota bacterium]
MTDRDWLLLKTIAEEHSITKAADRLYISQPALTYRVKLLEQEFKTKILIRTPNGVILTPQGEYLLNYAKEMILRLTRVKEQIISFGDTVKGPLRIGSSAIFANFELPQLLQGFLRLFPETEIFLKTGMSKQVRKMLEHEEVTVAIIRGDPEWKEAKHLLFSEPVCLVSTSNLEVEALPDYPRIIYGTDSSLQMLVSEWWRKTFIQPFTESMVVDTMDTCRRMVQHNLGWAIMPSIGMSQFDDLLMRPLFWPDGSPLIRKTWLCYSKYTEELPTVRAFIDFVLDRFGATQALQEES